MPVPIQIKLPGQQQTRHFDYGSPVATLNDGFLGQNSFTDFNSRPDLSNNTLNNSTDYVDNKMGGAGFAQFL